MQPPFEPSSPAAHSKPPLYSLFVAWGMAALVLWRLYRLHHATDGPNVEQINHNTQMFMVFAGFAAGLIVWGLDWYRHKQSVEINRTVSNNHSPTNVQTSWERAPEQPDFYVPPIRGEEDEEDIPSSKTFQNVLVALLVGLMLIIGGFIAVAIGDKGKP